jgi:hypothetical protein
VSLNGAARMLAAGIADCIVVATHGEVEIRFRSPYRRVCLLPCSIHRHDSEMRHAALGNASFRVFLHLI